MEVVISIVTVIAFGFFSAGAFLLTLQNKSKRKDGL